MSHSETDPSEDADSPKTTRAAASSRRPHAGAGPGRTPGGRKLDAVPDRIDAQDWFYQPRLAALPDKVVNCDRVPMILDQGAEGACTGFALAGVINFLRAAQYQRDPVSPRMLYEMARRYDEWPGEDYDGSSARGAMKGWVRHGVCTQQHWPHELAGPENLTPDRAENARKVPGGAFYRVMHREIRDMHAALVEVGAIYVTLMVHDGWDNPAGDPVTINYTIAGSDHTRTLPVIRRTGRAFNGHAVALVGYTENGFIVQNSWGRDWGAEGFALLPYEDFMIHATDVWVAQIGVPVRMDLWQQDGAETFAGLQRAQATVPLAEIRPYTIDIGNNGRLSDSGRYWTTPEDVHRLFQEIIPEATATWARRRVMFFLHGGLNDEAAVARRVIAFRDVMLANQIYPVHIMWESGAMESIRGLLEDLLAAERQRASGVAEWLRRTRDGLVEAKDWTFEMTASAPGTALWDKMKGNARLASEAPRGGMTVIADVVAAALAGVAPEQRDQWELHVVGHSAGAIFAAHAMRLFAASGIPFRSLQLMAPAMTVELFTQTLMPAAQSGAIPVPDLYVLSDSGETDDDVGPYGKSLLYLVSNAFEGSRGTPLLGMERFLHGDEADPAVQAFLKGHLTIAGSAGPGDDSFPQSRSETHGGFDNDPPTMNSIMWRILGRVPPPHTFGVRDLQY